MAFKDMMENKNTMTIRPVTLQDARVISEIYNYYVEHTVYSFEMAPVTEAEMRQRIESVLQADLPFCVGEENGRVVGFCYVHPWKSRAAYQASLETTIYLDKDFLEGGRGQALYEWLLQAIDRQRVHTLIACITLPNPRSTRLHERLGFQQVSHFKAVGRKFDTWLDIGDWQLMLE